MSLQIAFDRFMNEEFEKSVEFCTKEYLETNEKYYIELYYSGTYSYNLKTNKNIPVWPSKYSIFLNIPIFNSEEYENKCFDRVREQMINSFYNLNNIFI